MPLWDKEQVEFDTEFRETEPSSAPALATTVSFFSPDEILEICDLLLARFSEDEKIAVLFLGMPPEFLAALPYGANPKEKLLKRLFMINQTGLMGDHSPFYRLLKNALYWVKLLPEQVPLEQYKRTVEAKETELRR